MERNVVHVWASRIQRNSIQHGVVSVLPDVATDVEDLVGTIVCDSYLMLGTGGNKITLVGIVCFFCGVVLHQEPLEVPARSIQVDTSFTEVVDV